MLDPKTATIIIVGLLIFLLVVVPVLEAIPRIKEGISRRYILASIYTALAVACIVNFKDLDNSVRYACIFGGLVLNGLVIILFTAEKISFTRLFGLKRIKASLLEKLIEADFDTDNNKSDNNNNSDNKENGKKENE